MKAFKEAVRLGMIEAWDPKAAEAANAAAQDAREAQISEDDIM